VRLSSAHLPCALIAALLARPATTPAFACAPPDQQAVAAAFDLAANGVLGGPWPQYPASSPVRAIPPSLLKAVGWVESGWRQFTPSGRPLLSFDFGYGIMQITSGMAGAFASPTGTLDPEVQTEIASDYQYNIAYGARALAQKWESVPKIGDGNPSVLENWYYALWAYNGWSWVNNPNNPRFQRLGTPATSPATYPYQERVLYLVAHPPRDQYGNPLWPAVPVSLPLRSTIGNTPQSYLPAATHDQAPPALSAVYDIAGLSPSAPAATQAAKISVTNTGTSPWLASGSNAMSLMYHVFTKHGDPWTSLSPFSAGVIALGQGTTPLPANVLPGESATLDVQVQAPAAKGTYLIAWDLQQGGAWLSQWGVLPRAVALDVTNPAAGAVPTAIPSSTPLPLSPAKAASFLSDTSVPDGTVVAVRQILLKGWLLYNSGRVAWSHTWSIKQISGKSLGALAHFPLPPTAPCRTANLLIALRAPARAGSYTSSWRLKDARGHTFGDRLTIKIVVRNGADVPPPRPTPLPTRTVIAPPTPTSTPVG